MPDPTVDAETRAREAVTDAHEERAQVLAMLCVNDDGRVHDYDIDEAERRIDVYRDAYRTALLDRVRAEVAKVPTPRDRYGHADRDFTAFKRSILAALDRLRGHG